VGKAVWQIEKQFTSSQNPLADFVKGQKKQNRKAVFARY
tara:strand:+ start:73 stop:189 length:117 start_codon:yes stop_codon:yes gene_type:complete